MKENQRGLLWIMHYGWFMTYYRTVINNAKWPNHQCPSTCIQVFNLCIAWPVTPTNGHAVSLHTLLDKKKSYIKVPVSDDLSSAVPVKKINL